MSRKPTDTAGKRSAQRWPCPRLQSIRRRRRVARILRDCEWLFPSALADARHRRGPPPPPRSPQQSLALPVDGRKHTRQEESRKPQECFSSPHLRHPLGDVHADVVVILEPPADKERSVEN